MMVSRDGAFGILIGAAVGTLFLVPAHGSAQDSLSVSCSAVNVQSPLEDLMRCAEQGNAGAAYSLGLMYANGMGVPEDDTAALSWYLLAAELGHTETQYFLGAIYSDVPESYPEAVHWFRLAAEQGHAGAQRNLGRMYALGEGVPEDDVEAVRWFRLAAEQGNAGGQVNLGGRYFDGEGVPEDLVYAYMWFNLSAAQGNENAQGLKEAIEGLMTREQIAEAQRLSREWIETHPQDLP
jgi:TPR repeat protein